MVIHNLANLDVFMPNAQINRPKSRQSFYQHSLRKESAGNQSSQWKTATGGSFGTHELLHSDHQRIDMELDAARRLPHVTTLVFSS